MIITFTLSLVKFSTFLVNTLLNFSFAGECGNLTEKFFLPSNSHSVIIICSFPLLKLQVVSFINFNENPAFRYFCLIFFNFLLKSGAIRLARFNSPVIALHLYLAPVHRQLSHPACDVAATSHFGLIYVGTSRTTLRRHHDVATDTSMNRTFLGRRQDVSLAPK